MNETPHASKWNAGAICRYNRLVLESQGFRRRKPWDFFFEVATQKYFVTTKRPGRPMPQWSLAMHSYVASLVMGARARGKKQRRVKNVYKKHTRQDKIWARKFFFSFLTPWMAARTFLRAKHTRAAIAHTRDENHMRALGFLAPKTTLVTTKKRVVATNQFTNGSLVELF